MNGTNNDLGCAQCRRYAPAVDACDLSEPRKGRLAEEGRCCRGEREVDMGNAVAAMERVAPILARIRRLSSHSENIYRFTNQALQLSRNTMALQL